jgi:hypothetical protein
MQNYLEERSVFRRVTFFRLVTPNEHRLLPIRESTQSFNGLAPSETVNVVGPHKFLWNFHGEFRNVAVDVQVGAVVVGLRPRASMMGGK